MDTKRIVLSAVLVGALAVPASLLVASATRATSHGSAARAHVVASVPNAQTVSGKLDGERNEHASSAEAKGTAARGESVDDPRDSESEPGGPDTDNLEEGPGPTGDGPD